MVKPYKHLTIEKRQLLKIFLEQGLSKKDIAEKIGCHLNTVYLEIQKGTINGEYNPDYAQYQYDQKKKKCGCESFLKKDKKLAKLISDLILKEGLYPSRVIKRLKEMGYKQPSSVNTIYKAIDDGFIPNVTREVLIPTTTKIFSKGLVQIPVWMQEKLSISRGDIIGIRLEGENIILSKQKDQIK